MALGHGSIRSIGFTCFTVISNATLLACMAWPQLQVMSAQDRSGLLARAGKAVQGSGEKWEGCRMEWERVEQVGDWEKGRWIGGAFGSGPHQILTLLLGLNCLGGST